VSSGHTAYCSGIHTGAPSSAGCCVIR
jgi:hypothetical protein